MKKIFLYIFLGLVLIFSKLAYADNLLISSKGIKLGDSALKYFDKNFIENNKRFIYPTNEYFMIFVENQQINIKNNDKNYIIENIDEGEFIRFDECQNLFNNELKKYKESYPNAIQVNRGTFEDPNKHWSDPSGKSLIVGFDFYLNEHPSKGPVVRLGCVDWSKEIETSKNWGDNFKKAMNTKNFNLFLIKFQ